jgi:hypothetical protein
LGEDMNNEEIMKLLNYDPLYEAEKVTGKSYKEDEITSKVGFINMGCNNRKKETALKEIKDTYFNIPVQECVEIFQNYGYKSIYVDTHDGEYGLDIFYVMYNKDIYSIVTFDSFIGNKINSGEMYINVDFGSDENMKYLWKIPCSSSPLKSYKFGRSIHLDIREGAITKLKSILTNGNPIKNINENVWYWGVPYWINEKSEISRQEYVYNYLKTLPSYVFNTYMIKNSLVI